MIKINLLEGIRPPLPPPTLREILEVVAAALAFCALVSAVASAIVVLLI
ncbi:MAG: hypothetical protein JRI39_10245 [Deltaproteobacteria bacterium]|nr:hypothetical protein [Deltaproteobacteria bacterium]